MFVTFVIVPEPNVKPAGPYSTFQDVSEPTGFQEISAVEDQTFDAVRGDVCGHVADCLI